MIPIIEDYLSQLVEDKFRYIRDNPVHLSKVIRTTPTKTERLAQYLQAHDIKVIRGYPRDPAQLPCICIVLAGEGETQGGIGNDSGEYIEDEEGIYSVLELAQESNYRLECWSENGDLTIFLYHLLKWALVSGREWLIDSADLVLQRVSGSDFEPASNYLPVFVYRRAISFWCEFLTQMPGDQIDGYVESIQENQLGYEHNYEEEEVWSDGYNI